MTVPRKDGQFRSLIVIDFTCDHCGEKLDAVVIARIGTPKKIAKTYHDYCWRTHINLQMQDKAGAN